MLFCWKLLVKLKDSFSIKFNTYSVDSIWFGRLLSFFHGLSTVKSVLFLDMEIFAKYKYKFHFLNLQAKY